MKNWSWLAILAVLLAGVGLVACGGEEKTTPADTPSAGQPGETPSEPPPEPAPAAEPEPAPEPMPEPEPEPEPAGKQTTPWGACQVGDYVKMSGMNNMTMMMEVTAVGEETVTVKITTEMPGMPAGSIPAQEQEFPRFVDAGAGAAAGAAAGAVSEDLGTETLTIGGKAIECKVTQVKMEMGGKSVTTKTWTSDEIPGGMAKTMSDAMGSMQVMQEVVEFKKQ